MTVAPDDTAAEPPADTAAEPPADTTAEPLAGAAPAIDVSRGTVYLLARLELIRLRATALVEAFRVTDPTPDDPFRGLHVPLERLRWVLSEDRDLTAAATALGAHAEDRAEIEDYGDQLEAAGVVLRLRELAGRAELSDLDVELLLIAAAPELDRRFEFVYGYLNDDVSRRRASVSLALTLVGLPVWNEDGRSRLRPGAPLIRAGLVLVDAEDRPFLGRSLRVPERVISWLLGGDDPDPVLEEVLRPPGPASSRPVAELVGRALETGIALVYLREPSGASAPATVSALADLLPMTHLDLTAAAEQDTAGLERVVAAAAQEAMLRRGPLAAGPIDAVLDRPSVLRQLARLHVPAVLYGRCGWEPNWSSRVPLLVDVPVTSAEERRSHLMSALSGAEVPGLDPVAATAQYRLSVEQVDRAARSALLDAIVQDGQVTVEALRHGARAQNSPGLERLARRIEPAVQWSDLVLAPVSADGLTDVTIRAQARDRVLDEWGMRPGGGRGRGVTVLFAGDPGTGKTMSAEVVAGTLGMDLYVVSLPAVVDKYVGETEKNLERIFSEADGVNGILLFDEADAIFGKRSEVKDAHDRFANMETAYLLQRMESFNGVAILTTNLRANLDEAFARRLDVVVDFPMPDPELRQLLWERCLGPAVPRADELDLPFCARAFELSGGSIRSAAITAAYLAANQEVPVGMVQIVAGIQREFRKAGRLVVPQEFGAYAPLLAPSLPAPSRTSSASSAPDMRTSAVPQGPPVPAAQRS